MSANGDRPDAGHFGDLRYFEGDPASVGGARIVSGCALRSVALSMHERISTSITAAFARPSSQHLLGEVLGKYLSAYRFRRLEILRVLAFLGPMNFRPALLANIIKDSAVSV